MKTLRLYSSVSFIRVERRLESLPKAAVETQSLHDSIALRLRSFGSIDCRSAQREVFC